MRSVRNGSSGEQPGGHTCRAHGIVPRYSHAHAHVPMAVISIQAKQAGAASCNPTLAIAVLNLSLFLLDLMPMIILNLLPSRPTCPPPGAYCVVPGTPVPLKAQPSPLVPIFIALIAIVFAAHQAGQVRHYAGCTTPAPKEQQHVLMMRACMRRKHPKHQLKAYSCRATLQAQPLPCMRLRPGTRRHGGTARRVAAPMFHILLQAPEPQRPVRLPVRAATHRRCPASCCPPSRSTPPPTPPPASRPPPPARPPPPPPPLGTARWCARW